MNDRQSSAPVLIFTYGNPSRGDDALGPAMYDMLDDYRRDSGAFDGVDLLTDFQLQIEHAVDLENRCCVLFIDAGTACRAPYELQRLRPEKDDSFTTHAMSPAAVLAVFQQINQREPPPAYLLTIRAYEFGLGNDISKAARHNLQQAYEYVISGTWPDAVSSRA
ncbi:MAG: hydrogenase maturation protease [Lysobacterales bacterium]